jgi:glycerol transport system ATP-binding protein
VLLAPGVHDYEADTQIEVFLDPKHLMVFDRNGSAAAALQAAA